MHWRATISSCRRRQNEYFTALKKLIQLAVYGHFSPQNLELVSADTWRHMLIIIIVILITFTLSLSCPTIILNEWAFIYDVSYLTTHQSWLYSELTSLQYSQKVGLVPAAVFQLSVPNIPDAGTDLFRTFKTDSLISTDLNASI